MSRKKQNNKVTFRVDTNKSDGSTEIVSEAL